MIVCIIEFKETFVPFAFGKRNVKLLGCVVFKSATVVIYLQVILFIEGVCKSTSVISNCIHTLVLAKRILWGYYFILLAENMFR